MLLSQALASFFFLVMSFWARTHTLNEGQHAAAFGSCPTVSHEDWTCFYVIKSNWLEKKIWFWPPEVTNFINKLPHPPIFNFILKSLWRCLWAVLQLTTKKRWRCDLTYWTISVVHEQSVSLSFSLVTAVQRPDASLHYVTCPYFVVCTVHFSSHTGALLDASLILSVILPPAFWSWCFKFNLLSCVASEPNHVGQVWTGASGRVCSHTCRSHPDQDQVFSLKGDFWPNTVWLPHICYCLDAFTVLMM